MKHITIYADGSGNSTTVTSGCGSLIKYPDGTEKRLHDAFIGATNNQMELFAVIQALDYLANTEELNNIKVQVFSDSEYVVKGCTDWLPKWIARGWKTAKGPLKNKIIWQTMNTFINSMDVKFTWVRGHNGNHGNEEVDKIAGEARLNLEQCILKREQAAA
jgi:ribonuclease HI